MGRFLDQALVDGGLEGEVKLLQGTLEGQVGQAGELSLVWPDMELDEAIEGLGGPGVRVLWGSDNLVEGLETRCTEQGSRRPGPVPGRTFPVGRPAGFPGRLSSRLVREFQWP